MTIEETQIPPTLAPTSITRPLALALVNRLGLYFLAYCALTLLVGPPKTFNAFPGNNFLDGWARWDAHRYAKIARDGYTNVIEGGTRDTAFFPLFPLLMRLGSRVAGDVYSAG